MNSQATTPKPIKIFFSYGGDVKEFVQQFSLHFFGEEGKRFDLDDWLVSPAPAGSTLIKELKKKIETTDVFVAFVDENYSQKISAEELKMALTTCDGRSRPLLIPIILGRSGHAWWETIGSQIPVADGVSEIIYQGFYTAATNKWRDPTSADDVQNIQAIRKWVLETLIPGDVPPQTDQEEPPKPGADTPGEPTNPPREKRRVVLFGTPRGKYPPEVSSARDSLAAALREDTAFASVGDGWLETDGGPAAEEAASVADAGLNSVLLQVCDATLYQRYKRPLGTPPKPATAFGNDLIEKELAGDKVPAVVKRTLFWVPRIDAEVAKLRQRELDPTAATSNDLTTDGPWYGTAAPEELANWIRPSLSKGITFVKAQAGLNEVGAKFTDSLKAFFRRRVFVEQVDGSRLAVKVKGAVASGIPIIVVIHDVNIGEDFINGRTVEERLWQHVEDFDTEIEAAIRGIGAARVARALLLVRYAREFEGSKQWDLGYGSWVPLPLASDRNYQPPDDQLQKLRTQLGPGG